MPDVVGEYVVRVVGSVGDHRSEPVEYTVTILPWSGGLQLSSHEAQRVGRYDLAMDGAGNAVAIWQQEDQEGDQSRHRIYTACYYANSGGWSWENCLDDAAGFDHYGGSEGGPKVALNASGEGLAAWIRQVDGQRELWGSPYQDGNWPTPTKIAGQNEMQDFERWRLMVDPGGEKLAFWDTDQECTLTRWIEGSGWNEVESTRIPLRSAPLRVEGTDRLAVLYRAVVDNQGRLAIGYYDPDKPGIEELNGSISGYHGGLSLKSGPDGEAWLAWTGRSDGDTSFYASHYDTSRLSEPMLIAQDNNLTDARYLTHADSGEPVSWRVATIDGASTLWWSRYEGGSWSEPETVLNPFHANPVRPIAQPDGGWILVGEGDRDSDGWQIGAWHYSPDGGWESEVRPIESKNPGVVDGEIKVASDSAGNAVIIWRQYHSPYTTAGNPSGLHSARYSAQEDRWITE